MRALLIVLDSVGIGTAPDAVDYGDDGAPAPPHCPRAVGGLTRPAGPLTHLSSPRRLWRMPAARSR